MLKEFFCKAIKVGNFGLDVMVWTAGILTGLVPAIIMDLLYPSEAIISLTPIYRLISDVEVVYAFLCAVTILTIEQFQVENINSYIKKPLQKLKAFFLIIELVMMAFYIALKPFTLSEIVERLGEGYITLNKVMIIMSLLIAISLFITHSLPQPKTFKKEGIENGGFVYNDM